MLTADHAQTIENQLLATLPDEVYQRLLPELEIVSLSLHQVLYDTGEPIAYLYFPQRAAISLVYTMADGKTIEVGLVGREGVVGLPTLLGSPRQRHQAFVQLAGSAVCIPTALLRREFERSGALQKLLWQKIQASLTQTAQRIACNRFHTTEKRLACWLHD